MAAFCRRNGDTALLARRGGSQAQRQRSRASRKQAKNQGRKKVSGHARKIPAKGKCGVNEQNFPIAESAQQKSIGAMQKTACSACGSRLDCAPQQRGH
jgi:hypothetical protein